MQNENLRSCGVGSACHHDLGHLHCSPATFRRAWRRPRSSLVACGAIAAVITAAATTVTDPTELEARAAQAVPLQASREAVAEQLKPVVQLTHFVLRMLRIAQAGILGRGLEPALRTLSPRDRVCTFFLHGISSRLPQRKDPRGASRGQR